MGNRFTALKAMSASLPALSDARAAQKLSGQQIQLQSAIKSLPASAGVGTAQKLGAEAAKGVGEAQLGLQRAQQQTAQQVGQLQLGEQGLVYQDALNKMGNQLEEKRRKNIAEVGRISEQLKDKDWQKRFAFQQSVTGDKFLSELQYQDWLKVKGAKEEEWKDYAQKSEIFHARRVEMYRALHNRSVQALEQASRASEAVKNRAHLEKLQALKADWQRRLDEAEADAANSAARRGGIFTVGGTAVGAYFGGAQGAQIGGRMGGAASSVLPW